MQQRHNIILNLLLGRFVMLVTSMEVIAAAPARKKCAITDKQSPPEEPAALWQMHSSVYESGGDPPLESSDVLVAITTLVAEGRIQDKLNALRGYAEGPHCHKSKSSTGHLCDSQQYLCSRYDKLRSHVLALWQKSIPLCIEVLLTTDCDCGKSLASNLDISSGCKQPESPLAGGPSTASTCAETNSTLLLEQWNLTVEHRRTKDAANITTQQLLNAVRSQLHFSQLAAWFSTNSDNTSSSPNKSTKNIIYRLTIPGETFKQFKFDMNHTEHNFPVADIGNNNVLKVTMHSLPRLEKIPLLHCSICQSSIVANSLLDASNAHNGNCSDCGVVTPPPPPTAQQTQLFDDRMHFSCTQHGKHKCTYDEDDAENDSYSFRENNLKHKPKVRCLHPNMAEDSQHKTDAISNLPIFFNFEPLYHPEPDYLCRRDFESFMQNQPCSTTINFFTVPSTSKCVQNKFCNNLATNAGHHQAAQTKIPYHAESHDVAANRKSNQTSGFHEDQAGASATVSVAAGGNIPKINHTPEYSDRPHQASSPRKIPLLKRLSPTSPISINNANVTKGSCMLINDLNKTQSKSDILLDAIMRSSRKQDGREKGDKLGTGGRQYCRCGTSSYKSTIPYSRECTCLSETPTSDDCVVDDSERINAACDISDSKCDNMNEKMSDNINEIYSFISNNSSNKEIVYINENTCDSLDKFTCTLNNSIGNSNKTSNIVERRHLGTKKRLEIDVNQKVNIKQPTSSTSQFKVEKNGATPKRVYSNTKHRTLYEHTNSMSRLLIDNRKDLYRNGSALETKRRIDFEENGNRPGVKKVNDSDSMRKRLLLNANCSKNQESATELDRECEIFMQNTAQGSADIPTSMDQKKFRKSLDNAASMVFHSRTGLPLTSSPAPIRKGTTCFDYDSNINSVSAIRSALFELPAGTVVDEDSGSDCSVVSPCSPDVNLNFPRSKTIFRRSYPLSRSGLLGNFEESVLNGRLEPVSTVEGFTAEIGASGLFCPRHKTFPVTVFFYSLGDMDRMSVPYLGHINLGRKGYNVPKSGLVQITLFNPLGTVVKMFVISYDLSDMPPNSQTFMRQRTLYLPQDCPHLQGSDAKYCDKWGQKYLRFLIHLRFMSSKSGRIYLHTDIRMIIFNKADMDTATGLLKDPGHEMRSFIQCPTNPKFSPRL